MQPSDPFSPPSPQNFADLQYENDFLKNRSLLYQQAISDLRSALISAHTHSSD
jgi:hypothetical protein